jgi:hypothetical protein
MFLILPNVRSWRHGRVDGRSATVQTGRAA